MISADEIAFAGYTNYSNNMGSYLLENASSWWWSLSPYGFDENFSSVWGIAGGGYFGQFSVNDNIGIRPSISLVSNITISGGTGTSEDQYIVN